MAGMVCQALGFFHRHIKVHHRMLVGLIGSEDLAKLFSGAGVIQGELVGAAHCAGGFTGQGHIRGVHRGFYWRIGSGAGSYNFVFRQLNLGKCHIRTGAAIVSGIVTQADAGPIAWHQQEGQA